MSHKNLFAQKRLNLIFSEKIQYDKLKKETEVLTRSLFAHTVLVLPPAPKAVLPKVVVG